MKKHDRMEVFIRELVPADEAAPTALHPCYIGYFTCFNRGDYYEAHDVLEHLWLQDAGADEKFFRGLIQVAGAFVHLRKQILWPTHRIDGKRLHPATQLFRLGIKNISAYAPIHHHLNVTALIALCTDHITSLERSNYTANPWHPENLPILSLQPDSNST